MTGKQPNPTLLSSATAEGYQALPLMSEGGADIAQDAWQRELKVHIGGNDKRTLARAFQIDNLEGLSAGDKLYVLSINDKFAEGKKEGEEYRKSAIHLDIWYGMCAAIVPILIPFSQTYKEVEVAFWSDKWNVGEAIAITSIMASLLGTMIYTYQKASKTKEHAVLYTDESQLADMELSLFLSRSPPDYAYTGSPKEMSSKIAFSNFVKNYMKIRKDHNPSKFFEADVPATVGSHRKSTGGEPHHGGGVPVAGRVTSRASKILDTGHGTESERLVIEP